jgi:ATP-dependent RNA helicase DDX55/SPB4
MNYFNRNNIEYLLNFIRGIYDRSKQAFVSYVQAYAKHECSLLLRMKELDLCGVAEGAFALVHLPKMPELRNRDTSNFNQENQIINAESIPYK